MMSAASVAPDSKPGAYYVSVIRSDGDYRLVLGPFVNDHAAALAWIEPVRKKAEGMDPRAVWYAFGSVRLDAKDGAVLPAGILNKFFPEAFAAKEVAC